MKAILSIGITRFIFDDAKKAVAIAKALSNCPQVRRDYSVNHDVFRETQEDDLLKISVKSLSRKAKVILND